MRRLLIALSLSLLLVPAASAAAQEPTTLVVVETASVRVEPDVATLHAQFSARRRSAAAARRLVEQRVQAALARLDALGIPRADVRTTSISSFRTRRRGRVQHIAVTGLRVRTTDIAGLGRLLAALEGADIEGPELGVSDPTAARQEATAIALERARRRAEAAAAAMGMRLLAVRRVDLNPEVGYGVVEGASDEAGGGGGGGGSVTVETGLTEIEVAVAIVYEIGP